MKKRDINIVNICWYIIMHDEMLGAQRVLWLSCRCRRRHSRFRLRWLILYGYKILHDCTSSVWAMYIDTHTSLIVEWLYTTWTSTVRSLLTHVLVLLRLHTQHAAQVVLYTTCIETYTRVEDCKYNAMVSGCRCYLFFMINFQLSQTFNSV